jgi:hypothetical protein
MRVQISHRPPAETPRVTPPLITSSAVSLALTSLLLTACNFAPHYERPNTESTDTYKEATASAEATGVGWQSADPKDDAPAATGGKSSTIPGSTTWSRGSPFPIKAYSPRRRITVQPTRWCCRRSRSFFQL